jgi:hypothetical protein
LSSLPSIHHIRIFNFCILLYNLNITGMAFKSVSAECAVAWALCKNILDGHTIMKWLSDKQQFSECVTVITWCMPECIEAVPEFLWSFVNTLLMFFKMYTIIVDFYSSKDKSPPWLQELVSLLSFI